VRAHIDERLTLESIAAVAGFSPFHFHRIFRVACGENLNDYIVRHRLARAARELRATRMPVTEIGLRGGYESPSAFGRAFARAFGSTPAAYRAQPQVAALVPPGSVPPARDVGDPQFVELPARDALALRHVGPYDRLEPVVLRVRDIALRFGLLPAASLIGMSFDSPDLVGHDDLRFDACVTVVAGADIAGACAAGLRPLTIAGGRYAVFRYRGPYARITHRFDLITAAWVLSGRVELRAAPFTCTYLSDPHVVAPSDLETDLAIPIS
jgi:AraC family transcriptional regulator